MRCRVTVVGYVCVCVCVCVCVRFAFFQAVTNQSRRPTDLLSAAVASFVICFLENNLFTKIQNLSGSHIGAPVGHFAYSRRHPSVYPFTWCCSRPCGIFVTDFAIVFWHHAIYVSLDVDLDYMQSFAWRKGYWNFLWYSYSFLHRGFSTLVPSNNSSNEYICVYHACMYTYIHLRFIHLLCTSDQWIVINIMVHTAMHMQAHIYRDVPVSTALLKPS